MAIYQKPSILTERAHEHPNGEGIVAHMCSNTFSRPRMQADEFLKAAGSIEGEWKVKIVDKNTVSLTAPAGITFIEVEDVVIPIEEIVLAIAETMALQKRIQK